MSREQTELILQHPSIVGISRRRRLYAALVLAAAIFVVLLICLSFSIREFRAVQTLQIAPKVRAATAGNESALAETRELALQVVRNATSEFELRKLVAEWTNRLSGTETSGLLDPNQVDYEKLRARMNFAFELNPGQGLVALHLGYAGRGNQAEQAFLNLFAQRIASDLAAQGMPTAEQVAELRQRIEQRPLANQATDRILTGLKQEVARVDGTLSRLKDFPWGSLNTEEKVATETPVSTDPRIAAEESRAMELAKRREQLQLQYPESHPEVLAVRRELEQVRLKILELQESAPKRISNQFVQASFPVAAPKTSPAALNQLRDSIEGLDVSGIASQLGELQIELNQMVGELRQQNIELCDALAMEPKLRVDLTERQVLATGSLNVSTLLWALAAAMVLGGVIASRFDVWSFDRGFENSRAAAESLAVPVFAWGNDSESVWKKPGETASSRILKLSEIVLFTTLLVVAGMFLIDPEYRQAVVDNPLHAFARLLWMWKA